MRDAMPDGMKGHRVTTLAFRSVPWQAARVLHARMRRKKTAAGSVHDIASNVIHRGKPEKPISEINGEDGNDVN